MPSNAETYNARVEAVNAQRDRLTGSSYEGDMWTGARAERFRSDPRREPEPLLLAVMEYLEPDHVLLDIGGGAGRFGLPLALHCRELINVDPSAGMRQVFEEVAREAGITNVRYVQSDWLQAEGIAGDVSLIANVTYFVADIVPFIEKLQAASRHRVCIVVAATPPPNGGFDIFEAVHGEPLALLPGYRELLPVLWDLNILPEVRLAGLNRAASRTYATRQEAIDDAASSASLTDLGSERTTAALESRFDDLFVQAEGGYRRRRQPDGRQLLITWETA
jgi:hypothetical protein